MLKTLFISSSSACFEWKNDLPYYAGKEYTIYLNGKAVLSSDTNVFSLFGLEPDTTYKLTSSTGVGTITFRTEKDTCTLCVKDFGAKGDGKSDDSRAIQTAINCLPRGAKLYFPAGDYLTSPICLKSHIVIELGKGARILGSTDKTQYPVIPGHICDMHSGDEIEFGTWEGNSVSMYQSLLFAEYAEDITIIGPGTVDGNAQNGTWWQEYRNDPVGRPRLIFFNRCNGIRIHGITAQNSASWQLHPYYSKNIDLLDISIYAPKDSPNTDAIDPEACDVVNIIGCKFSVGDDCIAIKSSKIDMARKYKTPANRHTVRNCLMQFGHGAVTLGSEMSGGVTNLTVNKCVFRQTDRGLRIKTRRGRGSTAIIDGVLFENIKMEGVLTPIALNMWYNCCDPDRESEYVWSREMLPVDDRTPYLGEFTFRNMLCTDCEAAACYCDGLPEQPISSITLENIKFTFAENARPATPIMRSFIDPVCKMGMYFDNVDSLTLSNVTVEGAVGDELIVNHVKNITK